MVVSLFFFFSFFWFLFLVLFYFFLACMYVCIYVCIYFACVAGWAEKKIRWELLISQDCGGKGERLSRFGQVACYQFSLSISLTVSSLMLSCDQFPDDRWPPPATLSWVSQGELSLQPSLLPMNHLPKGAATPWCISGLIW